MGDFKFIEVTHAGFFFAEHHKRLCKGLQHRVEARATMVIRLDRLNQCSYAEMQTRNQLHSKKCRCII